MKKAILVLCMALCCVAVRGNAATAGTYGPVPAGKSLYRIALEYREQGISISQVMMSFYDANPDAFARENINRLKTGSTLDVPDPATIAAMDRVDAYRRASDHIERYEREEGALRAQNAEAASAAKAASDSDSDGAAAVAAAASATDTEQMEIIKQEMAADEQQLAKVVVLPEPKAAKRKKKEASGASVFRYSYDLSLVDDNNIRLAQHDDDIRADRILSGTLTAKGGKSLDSFSILNYGGSATLSKFQTFDTLNNYEIEINTRYRFALGSGFTAPIYTIGAKLGGQEFDSEMRDATFLNLNADLNKWLTDTINMTLGLGFNMREAKSEVFDTKDARIFVNFDTNFSKKALVYTTFSFITGDTVSSGSPTLGIVNISDAIEPDDAFGGVETNQFAYRFNANTAVVTLGYNHIFTRSLSMDLSARYVKSESTEDSSIYYDRTILRASLLGRF